MTERLCSEARSYLISKLNTEKFIPRSVFTPISPIHRGCSWVFVPNRFVIECAPLIFTGVFKMSLSSLFISNAYAQNAAPAADGGIVQFLPLFVLIVVFYFLILRPQQKRAKEQKAMVDALQKGDEVVAAGGLLGRISKVDENYVSVEVAEGVTLNVQKGTVQTVLPKGTIKSL